MSLAAAAGRAPSPGRPDEVAAGVVRLTADNPSLMTGPGTNSYLIGRRDLVVLDPGPHDPAHLDAIAVAARTGGGRVRAVAVTHHHADHAEGAAALARIAGVPVYGFAAVEGFTPDRQLADGDRLEEGDLALTAVHTPGHASDHLCFLADGGLRLLFSGDHVMGGSTVVIAPPDGDMEQYLDSLGRLARYEPPFCAIAPGHGPLLSDPAAVLADYLSHRLAREEAIAATLGRLGPATVDEIVSEVYADTPPALHPIARYSAWAHLRKLRHDGRARSDSPDEIGALWAPETAVAGAVEEPGGDQPRASST